MNNRIGIYPGTFDPLTNGHFDVIKRSLLIVDQLIIGVANNANKICLLSMEERKNIILTDLKTNIGDISNISVKEVKGLITDFAVINNAHLIIECAEMSYFKVCANTFAFFAKSRLYDTKPPIPQ